VIPREPTRLSQHLAYLLRYRELSRQSSAIANLTTNGARRLDNRLDAIPMPSGAMNVLRTLDSCFRSSSSLALTQRALPSAGSIGHGLLVLLFQILRD